MWYHPKFFYGHWNGTWNHVCHACDIELPYFLSAVGIHEENTVKK
jgi:hypothetical protein